MADFRTHVTFSSVLGCGYATAGMMSGMNASTALVAGGLCGVSGMLPDVDSDSGVPRREAMGFAAAIVPMLLVDRFRQMNFTHDQMVFTAAALYFFIRFVCAKLIGKWSVHRGMWHSIPAVLIFAGIAFLIAGPADDLSVRYFKAFAVGLGSFSHLVLDEIYSVDTRGVIPKFKKSFGSAIKFFGKKGWANFSTYAKLAVVALAIVSEPSVMAHIEQRNPNLANQLQNYGDRFRGMGGAQGGGGANQPPQAGNALANGQSQAGGPQGFGQRGFAQQGLSQRGFSQQGFAQQGYNQPAGRPPSPALPQQPAYNQQPYGPSNQRPAYRPQPVQPNLNGQPPGGQSSQPGYRQPSPSRSPWPPPSQAAPSANGANQSYSAQSPGMAPAIRRQ